MEALAEHFFNSPLVWNFDPKAELLEKRVKNLATLVLEKHLVTAPELIFTIMEENKRQIDPTAEDSPSKRVKVEEPPHRGAEQPSVPKTPEIPTPEHGDEQDKVAASSSSKSSESSDEVVEEEEAEELEELPQVKPTEVKDLNLQFPEIFTGEFSITEARDTPPSETEYEDEVIAPRDVENVRQKREPERYDDSKFEDIVDEKGDAKKKTKKGPTLEKQLGIKGKLQLILTELKEPEDLAALSLLDKPPARIKMFDSVINTRLQTVKSQMMLLGFPTMSSKDYNLKNLAESDIGMVLKAVIANTMKNVIIFDTATTRLMPIRHVGTSQLMYDMRSSVRSELQQKIHTFKFYSNPVIPEGLVLEQVPRNSLELVLLYVRMKVVAESGFEENSCFIVEFSHPRDLRSDLPQKMSFRLKYQYMIQLRWLYYLVNPMHLIESMTHSVWSAYKERNTGTDWSKLTPKEVGRISTLIMKEDSSTHRFLGEFVSLSLNFASLFDVVYFKNLFDQFHLLATPVPRAQMLTTSKSFS
jgi:hypothetical protein